MGKEEFRIQSLKGSWRECEERIRIQNTEFKMKGQRAEFKIKQELRIQRNSKIVYQGDAPIKGAHLSGPEIGVNIIYIGNPFCTNEKLNGFELGA